VTITIPNFSFSYVEWEDSLRFLLTHLRQKQQQQHEEEEETRLDDHDDGSAARHDDGAAVTSRPYYDMVMGFSQGANLATLLIALQERAPQQVSLKMTTNHLALVVDDDDDGPRKPADGVKTVGEKAGKDETPTMASMDAEASASPLPPPAPEEATPPLPARPLFRACVLMCGSAFGWESQWEKCGDVLPEWRSEQQTQQHHYHGTAAAASTAASGAAPSSNTNSSSDFPNEARKVSPATPSSSSLTPTLPLFDRPLQTPSLHLIGISDPLKAASHALAANLYGKNSATVVTFTAGHRPPTQKAAAMTLVGFMKGNLL
jgi:hypothetical protein